MIRRTLTALGLALMLLGGARAETPISAGALAEDMAIFERAYRTLHPALTRFRSQEEIDAAFARLRDTLSEDKTQAQAYIAISRMLAEVQCGHTYANFYNQPAETKAALFNGADKLPFTFELIGKRMIVTKNASSEARLTAGDDILSINGIAVSEILNETMALTKADGSRASARLFQLQVSGLGEFEPFDIYYPLLFPLTGTTYTIVFEDGETGETIEADMAAMTRAERLTILSERYGPQAENYDDQWGFEIVNEDTAYLRLGTFVTWKMTMDWQQFLTDAFARIEEQTIRHLILDVRGNAGGDNDVLIALARNLASIPLTAAPTHDLLRYETVPEDLKPYLGTWDQSFYDRTDQVVPAGEGFYTWKDQSVEAAQIPALEDAYDGAVYLLIGAGNSSATFTLAQIMKESGRGTLIGQETGGNLRGITGGQFFFLTLPNSRIASDIPLIAYYPTEPRADAGIQPDVPVIRTVEAIRSGTDLERAAAMALISAAR